jgi:hypothetical protein
VHTHPGVPITSGVALDHGFQIAYYTMLALLLAGVAVTLLAIRPARRPPAEQPIPDFGETAVEKAA